MFHWHTKTVCLQSLIKDCCNSSCHRFFIKEQLRNEEQVSIGEFHSPKLGLKCKDYFSCKEEEKQVA